MVTGMRFVRIIGRLAGGFIAQYLGLLASVNVFATANGGQIFWWTKAAIAIAVMMHTPDCHWPERIVHVVSGMAAYVSLRFDEFSVPILAAVCVSNGLGELFAVHSMKRFYPTLTATDVCSFRFLGIFILFPMLLGSIVASVPGSLGFYYLGGGMAFGTTITEYALGQISGTLLLLYPLLIVPVLWERSLWSAKTILVDGCAVIAVASLCAFEDYGMYGFPTIIALYGVYYAVSAYAFQCRASLIQLACTCCILALTSAGRGPFTFVIQQGGVRALLIGTQLGLATLTAECAFISISVTQFRSLRIAERQTHRRVEKLAEEQMLDLFRIGHDMRNNSTLVQAVCEMEESEGVTVEDKVKIVKAINILNDVLVCDMVEMVNAEKPKRLLSREDVDVVEVMEIYLMIARGLLLMQGKDKTVRVRANFDKNLADAVVVCTNRERLHQVVSNLVSNAVKYTEAGSIVFGVRSNSSSHLEIDVADSGIGMTPEDLSSVFGLFFRSKRASEINSGTGLGLFNVRKVCDDIGATIKVSSLGEGKGSTFTLVIPMETEEGMLGEGDDRRRVFSAVGSPQLPQFYIRALVIDDSPVIRKLMMKYLTSFQCDVVDVSSAEEARARLLDGADIDVVITDSFMGVGESGPDFIRNIRTGRVEGLHASTPCIICSGNQFNRNDTTADPRTIAVTKPFSSADIASALEHVTTSTVALKNDEVKC